MSNPHATGSNRAGNAFRSHPRLRDAFESLAQGSFHSKGTILFRQGEASRGVFVLLEGKARLSLRADSGRQVHVRRVGPGYVLGLPGTILNQPYMFTAELLEDSRVAFVPTASILDFLRNRADLCFDVVELLGGELADMLPIVPKPATRRRRTNA